FALRADLAGDARHFRCEGVQLIHHGVHGVLQLEDFAFHVDGDLARQVTARDRTGDVGDITYLARQVRRHRIDRVGEVLPCARDARHHRLSTELAFRADLAR